MKLKFVKYVFYYKGNSYFDNYIKESTEKLNMQQKLIFQKGLNHKTYYVVNLNVF